MNGTKKREQPKAAPSFQIADKMRRSRHSAAAADPPDVGGGDLRRNAHGHGAAVFNAHALTHGKAAGPWRVYQDLLTSAHIAHQQITAAHPQDLCLECGGHRSFFHAGYLPINWVVLYPMRPAAGGARAAAACWLSPESITGSVKIDTSVFLHRML